MEHELIPKHELLSEEEKGELLAKLGIEPEQLAKIWVKDPAIKDFNPKPGNIVKITRSSPTAGETTYYRLAVKEKW